MPLAAGIMTIIVSQIKPTKVGSHASITAFKPRLFKAPSQTHPAIYVRNLRFLARPSCITTIDSRHFPFPNFYNDVKERPGDKHSWKIYRRCESAAVVFAEWPVIGVGGKVSSLNAPAGVG